MTEATHCINHVTLISSLVNLMRIITDVNNNTEENISYLEDHIELHVPQDRSYGSGVVQWRHISEHVGLYGELCGRHEYVHSVLMIPSMFINYTPPCNYTTS